MNAQQPAIIKNQEYELLEAIAQDPLVTQAGLSAQLGIAVGGVNWYIKRLVNCGYVKVSHLDRTRLKYHLTPEGVSALTQRTLLYMRKSLQVYNQLRSKARLIVAELKSQGIGQVCLDGNDEMMDILRLTCIENGLTPAPPPAEVLLKAVGQDFQIVYKSK
jgi:DNA-binding MarR family transcriptional regulator